MIEFSEVLLENWRRTAAMPRLLLLTGVILLMADYAFAQDATDPTPMQCQLIRLAVAQYGFAAARQHALETYGPETPCFLDLASRWIMAAARCITLSPASIHGLVWTVERIVVISPCSDQRQLATPPIVSLAVRRRSIPEPRSVRTASTGRRHTM